MAQDVTTSGVSRPRDLYPPEGFPITKLHNFASAYDLLYAKTKDPRAKQLHGHHKGIVTMCNEAVRLDAGWETVTCFGYVEFTKFDAVLINPNV